MSATLPTGSPVPCLFPGPRDPHNGLHMQFVTAATTLSPHAAHYDHRQGPHSHAAPRGTDHLRGHNATPFADHIGAGSRGGGAPASGGGAQAPSRSLPLAVRLAAWREVGGLDPGMEPRSGLAAAAAAGLGGGGSCLGLGGGGAAEVDLSTRLWLAGWQVGREGWGSWVGRTGNPGVRARVRQWRRGCCVR